MIARLEAASHRLQRAMESGIDVDLAGTGARLAESLRGAMQVRAARAESAEKHLTAVAPVRVLERGFSITLDAKGTLVRKIADVRAGERLRSRVSDGVIESTVGGASPVRKSAKRRDDAGQPGLF